MINVIGEEINQRWTEEAKRRIRDSRIQATHNLVQAISTADPRPKVLVSQSAVGYYGDRGDAIVDEDTPQGTTFDAEVCVDWEAEAREAESAGVRVVVTRTAPILDKRGGLLKQLLLPFKLGLGGPIAGGSQYLPWIHLDDEVRILLWALDDERVSGTINASAPEPVTNREFSRTLGRVLHRPAVLPVPKLAVATLRGRARGHGRRRAAGGSPPRARPRVRVPTPGARGCAAIGAGVGPASIGARRAELGSTNTAAARAARARAAWRGAARPADHARLRVR